MKFFQNRTVALVSAAVILFGSTVLNLNRSLDKEADKLEAVWEGKYGIEEKLEERASNASQLWSVLRNYDSLSDECTALRTAYNKLYDSDMDMENAQRLFALNEELTKAALNAMNAAEGEALSSEDREWAERYHSNMQNAQRLIEGSGYNDSQRQFSKLLNAPHVLLLRPFLRDELPQEFA